MIDKDMMILSIAVNQFLIENGIDFTTLEDIEIDFNCLNDKNLVTIENLEFYIMEAGSYILENRFNAKINGIVYQELGSVTVCNSRFVCFKDVEVGV